MIARASQLFLPTLREPPADADAVSHKLLVRGGFIRQVGAGLFSFLPLGWRVHQKVVQIVREEMNAIGGQEMLCPVLTPAELWKTSGRYEITEVFKLRDRTGRELVRCENGDYAADREAARGVPRAPDFPKALPAPEEVETPGVATIDELAQLLQIDAAATSKAMPVMTADGRLVLGLVRGDDQLNEEKLITVLASGFRPATDDEIRATFGAGGGSLGPVGVDVEIVADDLLREGQYVAGANRDGW